MRLRQLLTELADNPDLHNATISHQEEMTAIAAYDRRIRETHDPELAQILAHNLSEERKHAAMLKAWLDKAKKGLISGI